MIRVDHPGIRTSTLCFFLMVLICGVLPGQETTERRANDSQKGAQQWTSLFNGTDLSGWTQRNGTATYRVVDKTIQGTTSEGSPNSFLFTDKQFGDFELRFEVKVDKQLNSGVQIRSHSKPDYKNGRVHGPQVEIEWDPADGEDVAKSQFGEGGYIYSEGTGRGWLSQDRKKKMAFKNGAWNRYRVLAQGKRIQTWINGTPIADLTDEDSYLKGHIGLQVHGIPKGQGPFHVRWRDLQIREIAEGTETGTRQKDSPTR